MAEQNERPEVTCPICNRVVVFLPDGEPSGAIEFTAKGNYGSALFDPGRDDLKLVLYIHDDCVAKNFPLFVGVQIRATKEHDLYMPAEALVLFDDGR
jgi:hypothetical protein